MTHGSNAFDPIRLQVVRSALSAATEEMAAALRRSAYSTNVKTRQDFSCAILDSRLRVVAQAFTQPVHLGSFVELIPRAVRFYGLENMGPGDMILVNDPYSGGTHLNDVTLIAPVYYPPDGEMGEPVAYLATLAHHVDVGGGAPASLGAFQEIYQEGVIIPPVKMVVAGEIDHDIFTLVLAQIRSKRETTGDFRAQVSANLIGNRRLASLFDRYGLDEIMFYMDELLEYTARRTRAGIAGLPKGTYKAEGFLDSDGFTDKVVKLVIEVRIDDDGVFFDTTGSDPQRRAPVNSTYAMTFSGCAYALRALLDKDLPVNDGFYRYMNVTAPPGTVTHAVHPAPVVGGWETEDRLNDLIFKALSDAVPERVPAGTKAMQCQMGFGVIDPVDREYKCSYEALAGGYGGRATLDGPDAVQAHGQNTENAPIEETEAKHPVRINRYELVENSDGPGKHRGGLGLRRDYMFPDVEARFTILADREISGPWGLFGGKAGKKAYYILNPDGEARELGSKLTLDLMPGDVVSYQTCGGGGYGPPFERSPELVLRDVREGKVSPERACTEYGVVVDTDNWTVDEAGTEALRLTYAES
ncbi:MAG: hydantoinase B/oxoprolinase family protein [Chloroflexi bacterium]|nr:hydantoinase B/oxoprolinase family protein [Chloroflexota bacterium]